ncbi:MAG: hypothetical protein IKN17_06345 [Ruminococcus sp.]|nr:hypothetical protein [Ruminococcus sp.]
MDIIGTWKIAKVMTRDEAFNAVWCPVEEYLADPAVDADFKKGVDGGKLIFSEDGTISFLAKIPEGVSQEEIDAALASGELVMMGDLMVIEKKAWKEVDGVYKFDTGAKGEVLGEPIDPWAPVKFTDDGLLEMMTYQYVKE